MPLRDAMTPARWASVKQVTLAALERTESERSSWLAEACAGDDALRRDVESLLAAHAKAGDFLERPGVAVTGGAEAIAAAALQGFPSLDAGRAVGPYRIIRELGQGGMGVVCLAERADATFEKQVAIKVVRGGLAGDLAMQRFRDERRILATLDHPNIARLLDGGATDDGLPYLVMEYVDGVPVDLYCQVMPVRRRLELFRQVCAAVQYAHQHLVIHRDLKARNILVTSDGTPKLLDFGIAKLLDPGTAPEDQTRTGSRALTLDGASPEQVRGEPMTVTSDVYSLGVLLYRLLTGQSPYGPGRRTDAELMHAICEEAPVRPSDVAAPSARELRGDLDVIVLKALRKEPERRYASVEPLAEDLRRYLAGHPVSARPDSLRYRAGKFVARHRVAVVAAAVVVVALAAAFVETSRQRARAERRLTDVRKLAGSFLFEFHDAIKDLSGATAARELVVKKAADYLAQLSAEESRDPTLLLETADAWRRLAAVQGLPTRFSLGHTADAAQSLERALALLDRLSPSDRKTAAAGLSRMRTLKAQGSLFLSQGRAADAVQRHREAGRILESIATAVDEPTLRAERTYNSVNLADALFEGGDMPSALKEFERTLAQVDGWLQQAPNDIKLLGWMGTLHQRIGDVLALQKRWPEARVYHQRSIDVGERLAALDVHNAVNQSDLGLGYWRLALAYSQMKDEKAALRELDRAVTLYERLSADDPANAHVSMLLAQSRGLQARSLGYLGRDSEAVAAFGQSITAYRARVAQDATNADIRSQLALYLTAQGNFFAARRRFAEARRALGDAREVREALARERPEYASNGSEIASLCRSLAKVEADGALALRGAARCAGLHRAQESLACAVKALSEVPAGQEAFADATWTESPPIDVESERARIEGLLATSRCGG